MDITINKRIKLTVSLLIPLGLGAIAGMFTSQSVTEWYLTLNRPSFNPPNWIFGPVWTTLYLILGISFFLIWNIEPNKKLNLSILIYFLQLILNFAWSFIFFYFKMIGVALLEIFVLWLSIIAMIIQFNKIKPWAAYINIPYLVWVTFAAILNASYYILNRS